MPKRFKHSTILFFAVLLGINTLVFGPQLLDFYLFSRFLSASLIILVFGVLCLTSPVNRILNFHRFELLMSVFVAWNGCSLLWADYQNEALFTFQRWLIFLGSYLLVKWYTSGRSLNQLLFLGPLTSILGILLVVAASYQLIRVGMSEGFGNESLYKVNVLFGHKSLIAAYFMLLIPLQLWSESIKSIRVQVVILIAIEILLILVLQSRTVYLSLLVFGVFILGYLYLNRKKLFSGRAMKTRLASWGFLVLILFGLMANNDSIRERLNPLSYTASATGKERTFVWSRTIPLIQENPWLGVGTGNWKIWFPSHGIEGSWRLHEKNVVFTRTHNDFLETFAELGIPGGLMYLLLFGVPIIGLFQSRGKDHLLRLLIVGGLSGFFIISILDFPKERIEFLILLAIYLCFAVKAMHEDRATEVGKRFSLATSSQSFWSKFIWIGLIVLMMGNLYAGWFRFHGESQMKHLFSARKNQNWEGMVGSADLALNRWYTHDPAAVPVHHYRGIALFNQQKMSEAHESFEIAYQQNPYNFHIINNLATSYLYQKNYYKAIELYQEVLHINWKFAEGSYNLAYCYVLTNRFDLALKEVNKIPKEAEQKPEYVKRIQQMITDRITNR